MKLFDTHAHLDQEEFAADLPAYVQRAKHASVRGIVVVGTTAVTSERCVLLANQFPELYAAVGIQPNYVAQVKADDWQSIERLSASPRVVAIGETGLDRYWSDTPFDQQQDYFDRHLQLAQRIDRPFIVHMRECGEDIAVMLREARQRGPLRGIMHSFTGDLALAQECIDLGLHISFAGMVTYKKSDDLRAVAAKIPTDRILIETDSPYLAPHPHRGKRPNEPALVIHTAACLAEVRGVSLTEFAAQTWRNACELFRCEVVA